MTGAGAARTRLAQARLALMLLTRLPAGRLADPAPPIGASLWAFPLAGAAIGLIGAGLLGAALSLGLPPTLAAGLAILGQVLATGALHEDGLADLADGLWGGRDRARRLEIMRDSRIGSYGVLALIVSVGLRWQALAALAGDDPRLAAAALIVLAMASRVAPAALLAALPAARTDGLGHAARGGGGGQVLAGALLALIALPAVPQALFALPVMALLAAGLGRLALARLGGQTGDVLGAAQQVAELGGWLVLAALLPTG
ncbi:adenosylcobinamide-GDP ribazoletransferase [Pontitalea aquivivens]|uniref:adenosylcobinamide-GDP ribazoletransferase n=1 Tax=Pontitalea aquivivens TaxID=3388663 RepID=UPI003970F08D